MLPPLKDIAKVVFACAVAAASLGVSSVNACTGITLKAGDQSVVHARTLEFAQNIHSKLVVIPRGWSFVGTTPSGSNGMRWQAKYAMTGMNVFNYPLIIDGINEKGLAVGLFYFPDYASYQADDQAQKNKEMAPWELGTFLLSQCQSIEEVKQALKGVRVVPVIFKQFNIVLPVHYIVTDSSGKSVVIEYENHQLHVYDNPIGILTNSPTFPWMITNLSNYTNMSVLNVPPIDLAGMKINSFGQGAGLLGLPGNFSPPSRFVRATVFTQAALPVKTGKEAVLQAFHLLNQFDLPVGAIRSVSQGKTEFDYTLWTSAADLKAKRYYFKTYTDQDIRMVDLTKINPKQRKLMWLPIDNPQTITEVNMQMKVGDIEK